MPKLTQSIIKNFLVLILLIVLMTCNSNPNKKLEVSQCVHADSAPLAIGSAHSQFAGKRLVFNDEFDGTEIDSTVWQFDNDASGNNGAWGNNELQYYTAAATPQTNGNAYVKDSNLVIVAKNQSQGGKTYTSARLHTHGATKAGIQGGIQYGIIEACIKLPTSASGNLDTATWPAFWMLGQNFNGWGHSSFGGNTKWPDSGEIDIMEANSKDHAYNKILSTAHWWNENASPATWKYLSGNTSITNPSRSYHIYTLEWTATKMNFYFDYQKFYEHNIDSGQDEFKKPFFILLNLAVGSAGTPFVQREPVASNYPQYMYVDWVRMYQ